MSDRKSKTVGFGGMFGFNLLIFDDVLNVSGQKIYNLGEISLHERPARIRHYIPGIH